MSTGTYTTLSGTGASVLKSINLTAGSWLLIGNTTFPAGTNTYAGLSITTLLSLDKDSANVLMFSTGDPIVNVTRAFTITSSQTWNLVAIAGSAVTVSFVNFYAIRIG